MTAEIAIMNAQAVALAADSAVTFGSKIKNTANKIFALSKFEPIAAMIYNNADFLGLPWETVVKTYRAHLSERSFSTVQEYADDFFFYLHHEQLVRRSTAASTRMSAFLETEFLAIREAALEQVKSEIAASGSVTPSRIVELIAESAAAHEKSLRESAPTIPAKITASVDAATVRTAIKQIFGKTPLSPPLVKKLIAFAKYIVRTFPATPESGFVVAGFGTAQLFPSLESYTIYTFADNTFVAVRDDRSFTISVEDNVYVIPFAQSEVVATFMDGVDPRYQVLVEGLLGAIVRDYPSKILDQVPSLPEGDRAALVERFRKSGEEVAAEYMSRLEQVRIQAFSGPITSVVQALPKDELAAMAESLVNLTSFKRKVSLDQETVGGPIDVAVVSKGDGLVWIKRKHYFEPRLNPQFFDLYYWRERHDQAHRESEA